MTSAVVAYQVLLKESPQTIKKAVAILKDHPYYKKTWEPRLAEKRAEDRDLYLFTMAARWPDDARSVEARGSRPRPDGKRALAAAAPRPRNPHSEVTSKLLCPNDGTTPSR